MESFYEKVWALHSPQRQKTSVEFGDVGGNGRHCWKCRGPTNQNARLSFQSTCNWNWSDICFPHDVSKFWGLKGDSALQDIQIHGCWSSNEPHFYTDCIHQACVFLENNWCLRLASLDSSCYDPQQDTYLALKSIFWRQGIPNIDKEQVWTAEPVCKWEPSIRVNYPTRVWMLWWFYIPSKGPSIPELLIIRYTATQKQTSNSSKKSAWILLLSISFPKTDIPT